MALVVGLTAGQVFAIGYCKDMNPADPKDKSFEDEITIDVFDVLEIDLYLNDVPQAVVSGGCFLTWNSADATGAVTDIVVADGNEQPGPWDSSSTAEVPNPNGDTGAYFLALSNLAGVSPDGDGDIYIGTAVVNCAAKGDLLITVSTIPGFDTWVGDSTVFDGQIADNVITVHQFEPPCECAITGPADILADPFVQVTAQYSAAPNALCPEQSPFFVFTDDCGGAEISAPTGLLTVEPTVIGETCNVCAMDTANTDDAGDPIMCCQEVVIAPGITCEVEIARGRECPGEAIDDPAFNRPGRRGLAATCDDIIDFTVCSDCEPFDPACLVFSIDPPEPFLSFAQIDECCWRLTIDDSCDQLEKIKEYEVTVTDTCNNDSDTVVIQIGKVIVDVQDATVDPESGSVSVDIDMINPEHFAKAVQIDIEECQGGEDNLICTECVIDPDRALEFTCSANEQVDGSCRVIIYNTNPAALIDQGRGTIATVIYDAIDPKTGDCVCLMPTDIEISDQFNEDLCACQDPGDVCFRTCGDIYPQDCIGGPCADTVCGDGVVDLFDILEAIDIILGLQTPTICQLENGDVPNGMPPYCGSPAGTPNCEGDGDVDIFDVLVMIDKALGKANCCDYCLFGQIF